jgi:hypothetical protein
MSQETRSLISWWKIRAESETDPFIKFFIMYMCLDAWITEGSGEEYDRDKLKWLKSKDNPLREYWTTTPNKKVPLQGLAKIGQVEDMHPKRRGRIVYLKSVDDFDQVIDFIYQIRCNLFHGGKSYMNTNDTRLVTSSARILENWINWTLVKTKP